MIYLEVKTSLVIRPAEWKYILYFHFPTRIKLHVPFLENNSN